MVGTDEWNHSSQEVSAFTIHQPTHYHNSHCVWCVCGVGGIHTHTYVPLSVRLFVGSGVKQLESTAFGITDTVGGCSEALRTVFSLLNIM